MSSNVEFYRVLSAVICTTFRKKSRHLLLVDARDAYGSTRPTVSDDTQQQQKTKWTSRTAVSRRWFLVISNVIGTVHNTVAQRTERVDEIRLFGIVGKRSHCFRDQS